MESILSVSLEEQLKTFRSTMEQNGREHQAEDIGQLIDCVQSIQMNLADAMEEADYLLEQLYFMKDSPMKTQLNRMQEDTWEGLIHAGKQLKAVESAIAGGIQNAVHALKEKGIQALDRVLDAAHVYQGLSKAETLLTQASAGMERKIEAVDRMAEEFHAMKGHAKNLGRAAVGKPAEEIAERDKAKGVLAKIRAGMEYCRKVLAGMGQKVLMARAHVVHLNLTAAQKTEKAVSVQEIARELRDASAMDLGRQPVSGRQV